MHCKCTAQGKKPNWKIIINPTKDKKGGGILQRMRSGATAAGKRCTNCGTEATVTETRRSRGSRRR